jgi:hypothetical protein
MSEAFGQFSWAKIMAIESKSRAKQFAAIIAATTLALALGAGATAANAAVVPPPLPRPLRLHQGQCRPFSVRVTIARPT